MGGFHRACCCIGDECPNCGMGTTPESVQVTFSGVADRCCRNFNGASYETFIDGFSLNQTWVFPLYPLWPGWMCRYGLLFPAALRKRYWSAPNCTGWITEEFINDIEMVFFLDSHLRMSLQIRRTEHVDGDIFDGQTYRALASCHGTWHFDSILPFCPPLPSYIPLGGGTATVVSPAA